MKENQIQIYYNTYQWEELSENYKNLMDRSIAAQQMLTPLILILKLVQPFC